MSDIVGAVFDAEGHPISFRPRLTRRGKILLWMMDHRMPTFGAWFLKARHAWAKVRGALR